MEYTRDRVHKYIHRLVCHGRVISMLLLLTLAAILIHGYHVGVEDQEVYLAAINKHLDPAAYPFNARFFTEQTNLTAFVPAVSATAHLFHSVAWALFLWQVGFIFLILWGCWKLAAACFEDERARWSGVLLVTVLLTLPIAGTRLYPLDQYLHPRAPAVCGILWALVASLEKRWLRAAACLLFATLMHPLMALFGASLLLFVSWPARGIRKIAQIAPATAMVLPFQLFHRPSDAWREAAQARTYYFLLQWTWYEWLGMVAPVLLVWWFARIARRHGMTTLELVASRLVLFAIFQFAIGVLLTLSPATEQLASFQPMRWLHIFYFLFLLMAGGLIGQFLLRGKAWRWLILFLPLAVTMFYVQRETFSYSDHIELPGRAPKNPWAKAFLWLDVYTPKNAVFAIDPDYMGLHAEDGYGIRAIAKRSLLAENQKDPGAATVFPDLAPEWREQVHAQQGIEGFDRAQFHRLKTRYDVSWTVLPAAAKVPLQCPYRNEAAQVCKVE